MTSLITPGSREFIWTQPQPNFPKEDLTDHNSAMLEILLQDAGIRGQAHVSAETAAPLYRMSHMALRQTVPQLTDVFRDEEALAWFHYGVAQYEAAAGLLQMSAPETPAHFRRISPARFLLDLLDEDTSHGAFFANARMDFLTEQPNMSTVIGTVTERENDYKPGAKELALSGAATQRKVELAVISGIEREVAPYVPLAELDEWFNS